MDTTSPTTPTSPTTQTHATQAPTQTTQGIEPWQEEIRTMLDAAGDTRLSPQQWERIGQLLPDGKWSQLMSAARKMIEQ